MAFAASISACQHSLDNLNNKDTKALIFILCPGVFVVNYLDKLASIN